MWKDLTMQQRSDLMQITGIFDPVRLRQEYDAYLIGIQSQDYQEEPNEYKKGGSINIKHPGRLTALKKRTGKTEAELWATGNKDYRRMITFARNSRKWKHQDGGYLDDIIWDNMGQWSHPGQITGITGTKDGTDITMNGVADYLIGKDNLGNVKFMKPGMDYHFPGSSVVEYPLKYQFGGLFKKKETPNYLYTTYGLNSQGNATFTGSYNNPIFGYRPSLGINQSIGRDYSMPDYGAVAIVSEPLYMNEQPSPRQMDLVDLKNRQLFTESRGNERAKSPRGASGLYQIMPDTAKWYADSTGNKGSVWDPTYNEQIRDWLMERLYNYDWAKSAKTDEERWRRAYAGYNWGSGNMSKAISKYGDDWYKHAPKETRDYVTFIIDNVDVGKHTTNEKYNETKKSNKYFHQYGGLIKPFSYTDIPVVRYNNGGNLFQGNNSQIESNKQQFGTISVPEDEPYLNKAWRRFRGWMNEPLPTGGQRHMESIAYATPILGEAMMIDDVVNSAKRGNYREAAITGALALLPGSFGKSAKNTKSEIKRLANNSIDNISLAVYPYAQTDKYKLFSEYPAVNIFKNEKPDLNVEQYADRHKNRIINNYGQDAYDNIMFLQDINRQNEDNKKYAEFLKDYVQKNSKTNSEAEDNFKKYMDYSTKQEAFSFTEDGYPRIVVVNTDNVGMNPRTRGAVDKYGKEYASYILKSHETDHALHIPSEKLNNSIYDFSSLNDEMKNYFTTKNNTELAARGSQLKDYFNSDVITENQLRYAARHYIEDTGTNNNMDAFFNGIVDWKKMAEWITKNSSIIASPIIMSSFAEKQDSNGQKKSNRKR